MSCVLFPQHKDKCAQYRVLSADYLSSGVVGPYPCTPGEGSVVAEKTYWNPFEEESTSYHHHQCLHGKWKERGGGREGGRRCGREGGRK